MSEVDLEEARRIQVGPLDRIAPQSVVDGFDRAGKSAALMAIRTALFTQDLRISDPVGRLYVGLNHLMTTVNPLLQEMVKGSCEDAMRIEDSDEASGDYTAHLAQFATFYDLKRGNAIATRHLLIATQLGDIAATTEIMARKGMGFSSDVPNQIGPRSWQIVSAELRQDSTGSTSLGSLADYLRTQQAGPTGLIPPHCTRSAVISGVDLARESLALIMGKMRPPSTGPNPN